MCKLVSVFLSFRKWQSPYRTWRRAWVSWRRTRHCALFCPHYSLSAISLMDQMWVMAVLTAFSPPLFSFLFEDWGGEAKEVIKDWKHTYSKPLSVGKRTKQVKAVSCHLGYFPFLFRPGLQHYKADLGAGQWLPVLYHIWLRFSYLQANEAFMWTCIRADYWPAWLFQSILYYCLMELMVISSAVAE